MDPALIQVIDHNRELREELSIEVNINRSNEKKIRHLERELDQCSRTISLQDTKIIAHEAEIEDLNSQIIELRKHLRKALRDIEQKDKDFLSQDQHITDLEDKIYQLKNRIRDLTKHTKKNLDMSTTDLFVNIYRGLDRIQNIIEGGGSPMANPVNIIEGIRGSLNTVRGNYQNLQTNLDNVRRERNDRDNRINRLQGDIVALNQAQINDQNRNNQLALSCRLLERKRERDIREKFAYQVLSFHLRRALIQVQPRRTLIAELNRIRQELQTCQNERTFEAYRHEELINELEIVEDELVDEREENLILNQRINNLQNINMAGIQDVMTALSPIIAQVPQYTGQEAPDEYYNKITQLFTYGSALGVGEFNDGVKANILKSKMGGRFAPVPPEYPVGTAIDTPVIFLTWLRDKYREVMIGTNQASMKALMNEKFSPLDTPDTYESRIRPFTHNIPDPDLLPILFNHLPENLELRVRIGNPADRDAFFTELRNRWLESGGMTKPISPPTGEKTSSNIPIPSLPQRNEALDRLEIIAMRLGYPDNAPIDPKSLDTFIETELERRLGTESYHITKEPFGKSKPTRTKKSHAVTKKSSKSTRHCSNCGKTGHTKPNCPKKKKSSKRVNYAENSSDSSSDSSSSEESDSETSSSESEDSEPKSSFGLKKK